MTLVLTKDDVVAAADMRSIIGALEAAIVIEARGGVESVPRINLSGEKGEFFRVMPAVIGELDLMGLKAFNSAVGGAVRYLICLWSASSGELIALLDASELTAIRTGAVTGVAQRAISGGHFDREVGVIGSGLEARTNLEAIAAVADIELVKVFSPRPERRKAFARAMTEKLGIEVRAVDSGPEAADASTVLVATNTGVGSGILALEASWLRAPCHVAAIGSTMPGLREVEGAAFGRADLVVLDTLDAVGESGDLLDADAGGHLDRSRLHGLAEFFTADPPPVNDGRQTTVFKSVGTALQDLVSAKAVFEVARSRGLGREVDLLADKKFEGLAAVTATEGGMNP